MEKIIEIPEGVSVEVKGSEVIAKANGKEAKRKFDLKGMKLIKENNQIKIVAEKSTKRELTQAGTIAAHIRNMANGVKTDFIYKLEICNVHFPMTVKVDGSHLRIKTFLGEVTDRVAEILPNVNVDVKGNIITVSSFDKEAAGQTTANIEKATIVEKRDRRVFQDGIFLTERNGVKL